MSSALDRYDWLLSEKAIPTHSHDGTDPVFALDNRGELCEVDTDRLSAETRKSMFADLRTAEVADDGPRGINRRTLFAGVGGVGLGAFAASNAFPRYAFAETKAQDTLVVIFLRGGIDGLAAVPPVGDPDYYRLRPKLAVRDKQAINLDGYFGLHPGLQALQPLWNERSLAIIHATGSMDPTRSHFEKQASVEQAAPATQGSGWIGRHLSSSSDRQGTFRAMTFGNSVSLSMISTQPALAVGSLGSFELSAPTEKARAAMMTSLEKLYRDQGGQFASTAKTTFDAIKGLAAVRAGLEKPENSSYPKNSFARGLQEIASVMRAGRGLEAVALDFGGWDMHTDYGAVGDKNGWMHRQLLMFAEGLAAFRNDLKEKWKQTTVVVMSEFGRRGKENASNGTDHGFGNAMFVLGGSINGGKVYHKWPSLKSSALDSGDLDITIDYRGPLSEIVANRLGNPKLDQVFPGFTQATPLGLTDPLSPLKSDPAAPPKPTRSAPRATTRPKRATAVSKPTPRPARRAPASSSVPQNRGAGETATPAPKVNQAPVPKPTDSSVLAATGGTDAAITAAGLAGVVAGGVALIKGLISQRSTDPAVEPHQVGAASDEQ